MLDYKLHGSWEGDAVVLRTDCCLLPSPGHGSLCRHDRLRPPAQPQGLLPAPLRAPDLRRLLGKACCPEAAALLRVDLECG